MKAQSYLIRADRQLTEFMRKERLFTGPVFMHENKGKKYPYSSERQNNRKKK